MPPTDVNSQKNDPAFKPPPRIEAGSSREKSTTPYRLVVPFPVGQTSQGTSQGASQSTSTSQGASQVGDAMHDVEITSPMYIANVDVRARDDLLKRARDEREFNRARDEQQLNRAVMNNLIVPVMSLNLIVPVMTNLIVPMMSMNLIVTVKVTVIVKVNVMKLKVIVLQQLLTIVR